MTMALVEKTEVKSILTSFNPSVLNNMENGEILDLIGAGVNAQENVSDLIAYSVVTLIERGAYDLVKARFGGNDGEDDPTFLVTKTARQALAARLTRKKWTQQQIADLFGVGQRSIAYDLEKNAKAEGIEKPKAKPRGRSAVKEEETQEPVEAEVVEKFTCARCKKTFGWQQRIEFRDENFCEPCADAEADALEHQEEEQAEEAQPDWKEILKVLTKTVDLATAADLLDQQSRIDDIRKVLKRAEGRLVRAEKKLTK